MDKKKIKICGIFEEKIVDTLNETLPDFIGFVFAPSRRKVSHKKALAIRKELNPSVSSVGVFVNNKPSEIIALVERGVIGYVQLHGDEDEKYIDALKSRVNVPIIKAVKVNVNGELMGAIPANCDYVLLDTYDEKKRGGTGKSFDFLSFKSQINKPIFLAGGLNEANIQKAKDTDFFGLDISGGVETAGKKDKEKIRKIIEIIRR